MGGNKTLIAHLLLQLSEYRAKLKWITRQETVMLLILFQEIEKMKVNVSMLANQQAAFM